MPVMYDIKKSVLFKKGIEQGIEQGMRLVVERGLKSGMTYDQIQTMTKLSIKQIKEIEKELKNSNT